MKSDYLKFNIRELGYRLQYKLEYVRNSFKYDQDRFTAALIYMSAPATLSIGVLAIALWQGSWKIATLAFLVLLLIGSLVPLLQYVFSRDGIALFERHQAERVLRREAFLLRSNKNNVTRYAPISKEELAHLSAETERTLNGLDPSVREAALERVATLMRDADTLVNEVTDSINTVKPR